MFPESALARARRTTKINAKSRTPHEPEEFNSPLLEPDMATTAMKAISPRRMRALRIVSGFLLGQGAAQGIAILAGLFLVHIVSIEAYAQFGVASGFQSVFSVLMDLGFAGTIVPMVGEHRNDRALVGRYVRGARHLRDRGFWLLAPVAAVAFLIVTRRHHWGWTVQLLILASVLANLYSSGRLSYFSAPLFIFGRLREYYVTQVIAGGARLAAYLSAAAFGGLNGWSAAALNALSVALSGTLLGRASRRHLIWPKCEDPEIHREL